VDKEKYGSLDWYTKQAQGVICKYGYKSMLYDFENIGIVANYMMVADQTYDESKGATRQTWRIKRGIYAIRRIWRDSKLKKNKKLISLSTPIPGYGDRDLSSTLENKSKSRDFKNVNEWVNHKSLNEKQKKYLKMYYIDEINMSKIAKREGVSRQAVHFVIKKAIESIKNYEGLT